MGDDRTGQSARLRFVRDYELTLSILRMLLLSCDLVAKVSVRLLSNRDRAQRIRLTAEQLGSCVNYMSAFRSSTSHETQGLPAHQDGVGDTP